jgi:hypothetical protein
MLIPTTPEAAENTYFQALLLGDVETLRHLLAEDFLLIDVKSGSEITREELLGVMQAGQLAFLEIDRPEWHERLYGPNDSTAVITGRTQMRMRFLESEISTASRYTHVYVETDGVWRMVAAQGTPIVATG